MSHVYTGKYHIKLPHGGLGWGLLMELPGAVLKKNGRNCGQSGGRNFFFFFQKNVQFGREILSILKKRKFFFCKNEKKVSSRTFFRHPAGPPETDFFLDWPGVE